MLGLVGENVQVEELKTVCREAIAAGREAVVLVLPGPCRGNSMRLCKTRGPLGEVLCSRDGSQIVARFKAKAVLKFIEHEAIAETGGERHVAHLD